MHSKSKPPKQPKAVKESTLEKSEEQKPNLDVVSGKIDEKTLGQFQSKIDQDKKSVEYNEYLFKNYVTTAKNYADQSKYQDAYSVVMEALKLNPTDQEALMLKNLYGSKLGLQAEEISERLSEAEKIVNVKIEQTRMEAENRIAAGKQALAQKQYEQAIASFKQAKEILRWLPYHVVDLEGKARQMDFLIQKAEEENKNHQEQVKKQRMMEAQEQAKREELARLKTLEEQVRNLFRQANLAFERQRYDLAENFCEKIQTLDPDNKESVQLLSLIRQARHSSVTEESRLRYLDEWKKTFQQIEEAMVPSHQIVQFPSYETWKNVSKRSTKVVGQEDSEESPQDRKIKERIETETVSMDFVETSLREVVDFLRSTTGINIIIDPEVYKEFPEEEALKVDLTVNNLRLESILNLMLSVKGLAYRISNGVLVISTKKRITEKPRLKLYNVRDLTGKLNDFPSLEMSLVSNKNDDTATGAQLKALEAQETRPATTITEEQLTDLIKNNIGKGTWDTATRSIDTRYGTLIIRQTDSVHKQIESLLNDLRKATGLLVTVETRFLTVSDDFLEDVGVDWRSLGTTNIAEGTDGEMYETKPDNSTTTTYEGGLRPGDIGTGYDFRNMDDVVFGPTSSGNTVGTGRAAGLYYKYDDDFETRQRLENIFDKTLDPDQTLTSKGGLSMQVAYIDEVELQMILKAVRKQSRKNVLTAPKLTVFNTQRANVTIVTQYAYVQDYSVEIATNSTIADPIVGTVQDGVVLDVRPIISADRKYITMELQPTVATLKGGAVSTFSTSLASSSGSNTQVEIGLPEISMTRLKTTVTIPDGGTLLLGGMMKGQETDSMSGVPVLSDLPILNFLTSRRGKFSRRESLLILVTAQITSMEEKEPNEGRQE